VDLARLNDLPADEARQVFLDCCASTAWSNRMADRRPFADPDELLAAARAEWWALGPTHRSEAFAAHPRVGGQVAGNDRHAAWSRREQSGAADADEVLAEQLADCNREYERRFGRVYLVFATGKSASEMLALCQERLDNDAETEYQIASAEQEKITDLRLRRLVRIG
jgi:2-oxo-4-hydroxy-4-carboxy-5-ureidoimidazoline decarboxylase